MNILSIPANIFRSKGLYLIETRNEEYFSLKAKILKP
jgi:hypothetical protein